MQQNLSQTGLCIRFTRVWRSCYITTNSFSKTTKPEMECHRKSFMYYLKKKRKKRKFQSAQLYTQNLRHTYHISKVKLRRWRQLTWFQIGQKGISHSHSFRSSTCQSHTTWGLNSLNTPVRRFKGYCVKEQSRKLWQGRNFQALPETSLAEHTAAEVEFLLREKQLPLLKRKTQLVQFCTGEILTKVTKSSKEHWQELCHYHGCGMSLSLQWMLVQWKQKCKYCRIVEWDAVLLNLFEFVRNKTIFSFRKMVDGIFSHQT